VAWGTGGIAPYWMWQQVLGSLARTTDVAAQVHPASVAWLAELVPELARPPAPPAPALDPDWARDALQRAVVHVLALAATDRPLLVVLDDLHDADAASLALAILVCRSLADSALLVVTTQRPVGPGGEAASPELLGQLNRQGTLVPVGALDQAAVAQQAAGLVGTRLDPAQAAWLHRASGATRSSWTSWSAGQLCVQGPACRASCR
jgi:hypothetical protein